MKNEIKETKYKNYYATKYGQILSTKIPGGRGKTDNNYRCLRYKIDRYGYLTVCLSLFKNNKQIRIYVPVHKLVYETFNCVVPKNMTIDHIDNNRLNNRLDNLQLLSVEDNLKKQSHKYGYGKEIPVLLTDYSTGISEITTCRKISDRYNIPIRTVLGLTFRKNGNSSYGIFKLYGIKISVKRVEDIEKIFDIE